MIIDPADLQAKSDQLNAVDFARPMIFKAVKVDYKPKQPQPVAIHMEGYPGRPYKPCKSMLRGLVRALGEDTDNWNNRLYELFCDPTVKWAGEEIGGIRISAISGIDKPVDFPVQLNKSKRKMHTFKVLADQPVKKEFIITHWQDAISKAETNEAIDAIVKQVNAEFGGECLGQLKDDVIKAREKFSEDFGE